MIVEILVIVSQQNLSGNFSSFLVLLSVHKIVKLIRKSKSIPIVDILRSIPMFSENASFGVGEWVGDSGRIVELVA